MANKLKTTPKKNTAEKPGKSLPDKIVPEKEEKVDLKKLARDERTWKIAGTVLILVSVFLFIAFISYFFTWKEDQDKVFRGASSFLFDDDIKVANLLGRLGAFAAHFFMYKGFGVASLLICTFFFIVGANFLFGKKVFSIWRNLRYVIVGLLVISVSMAFAFSAADFPFGGAVGLMISNWMKSFIGSIGTGAVLLVAFLSYIIWQFNPVFTVPQLKSKPAPAAINEDDEEIEEILDEEEQEEVVMVKDKKKNKMKGGEVPELNILNQTNDSAFEIVEKDEAEEDNQAKLFIQSPVEEEVVSDILHTHENPAPSSVVDEEPEIEQPEDEPGQDEFELEIKEVPENGEEPGDEEKGYKDLPPYEPTLDLRDYKYPALDLLETHGSEKIVQDPNELENNKNQIINTLKNYDIDIQKISATVGPTVTLYEIVPAAGVRISRIKNLEDDIALSLAALGIRIIAPIPGKGTIGIEVPNVKKSSGEHENIAGVG